MTSISANSQNITAFLFPGQGSQAVGMGLDLYESSKEARKLFEEVDLALGEPVSRIFFEGPDDVLRQTINTQPGIMTVSLACSIALEELLGKDSIPTPSLVAGHSLGQYTALVASGALDPGQGVRLVRERGRLMQYASEQSDGAMAAILGMDEMILQQICADTNAEISNVNAADQIVISGQREDVEKTMEIAAEKGARRTIQLPVGGAFHSRLMEPAQEGLAKAVEQMQFSEPNIPIIANCTGQPIQTIAEIKAELLRGLCSCVRWKETLEYMASQNVSSFYEIGPGKVLTGLVKRMDPDATTVNISDVESINALIS